jgi:predicted RNA-binding protein with PIN domain
VPILVDGDNLLGTWPGRRRSDAERRALAFELGRFAARQRRRVVVVFDGPAPPSSDLGQDVLFAGSGRSADDVILGLLRNETDPRGWTVATSDRSLGDQCRWLGARIERSDRFRRRLGPGRGAEKPDRETDVAYWLERFGDD